MADRKNLPIWLANVLVPLVLGLAFYLAFRPSAIVSRSIYGMLGISPAALSLPEGVVSGFMRCWLCDMLWAYAFTSAAVLILGHSRNGMIAAFIVSAVFFTGIELLQTAGVIYGTFDAWDIVAEIFAAALSLSVVYFVLKRRQHDEIQS